MIPDQHWLTPHCCLSLDTKPCTINQDSIEEVHPWYNILRLSGPNNYCICIETQWGHLRMLCMFHVVEEVEAINNYEPPKAQRTKRQCYQHAKLLFIVVLNKIYSLPHVFNMRSMLVIRPWMTRRVDVKDATRFRTPESLAACWATNGIGVSSNSLSSSAEHWRRKKY